MTDHHNEELLGLLDRIKEFLRTQVYPLESDFLRHPFRELTPALNETVRSQWRMDLRAWPVPNSVAHLQDWADVSVRLQVSCRSPAESVCT